MGRQHRLKAPTGTAGTRIVAAEFLDEFLTGADGSGAALDVGLAEGTPCDVYSSVRKDDSYDVDRMTASYDDVATRCDPIAGLAIDFARRQGGQGRRQVTV